MKLPSFLSRGSHPLPTQSHGPESNRFLEPLGIRETQTEYVDVLFHTTCSGDFTEGWVLVWLFILYLIQKSDLECRITDHVASTNYMWITFFPLKFFHLINLVSKGVYSGPHDEPDLHQHAHTSISKGESCPWVLYLLEPFVLKILHDDKVVFYFI